MASAIITPRYCQALQWAAELHRDQQREGKTVPYLSHLMAVSSLVWEDGGDEDQAIAGLLHDAIEDAGQSHGTISERFRPYRGGSGTRLHRPWQESDPKRSRLASLEMALS